MNETSREYGGGGSSEFYCPPPFTTLHFAQLPEKIANSTLRSLKYLQFSGADTLGLLN